jgi:hypothetical protein
MLVLITIKTGGAGHPSHALEPLAVRGVTHEDARRRSPPTWFRSIL